MKKEEKARQLEEFRVENPPYIYRPTVLQILKYRHFEIKDKSDPIPKDFIVKNHLKKGFFGWE